MKKSRTLILMMLFISGLTHNVISQPNYPKTPENAELVYVDLENFLEAYDLFKPGVDSIAVLNQYYFDRASIGLKEYISKHGLTPELMIKAIQKDPEEYDLIENFVNNIEETNNTNLYSIFIFRLIIIFT